MEQQIQQAILILKNGGVGVYPTDTLYGLGADAFNEEAVGRIYRIKQRPSHQPLSLLLADKSELVRVVDGFPEIARILAECFWPGGLTLVVPRLPSVPDWVAVGGDTVAVRVPDHPITLELIRALGSPLIGTSANLSGLPGCTTADEVRSCMGDEVDFILDGGICPGGIESTIVDVSGKSPVILREGAVRRNEIDDCLRRKIED